MKYKLIPAVLLVFAMAACTGNEGAKQQGGTLVGAGLGALLGSQIGGGRGQLAAVAIGALAGAFLGGEVGKSLDNADRAAMQRTTQSALETGTSGQAVAWRNPDSGHHGSVTPQPAYQQNGQVCREYQQTVTIDGRSERVFGRACRQSDGSWKIVN